MIYCEEKLLKSFDPGIKRYALDHVDNKSFFDEIEALRKFSLQSKSFDRDFEFFEEVNKLLSVFATVINHPYIINQRESVVVRAEQAYGLTSEMFRETVGDSRLWKDKNGVMTPSKVYYYRSVDDLRNYENRFIVYLINFISARLKEYMALYDMLVGTMKNESGLVKDNSSLDKAFFVLDSLDKKLKRIKDTDFYKIVSKANTSFTHVEPTNVLKHNRAYTTCYKFYIRHVTYRSDNARLNDLIDFYFIKLIIGLKREGFTLSRNSSVSSGKVIRKMSFKSDEYKVSVSDAKQYGGLKIVFERLDSDVISTNLLIFDSTLDFAETEQRLSTLNELKDVTIDVISLWDTAYVDGVVIPNKAGRTQENRLLCSYVQDKTTTVKGSKRIYETHCPVCGGKDINVGSKYRCGCCGTEYVFAGDKIWLSKLRRK